MKRNLWKVKNARKNIYFKYITEHIQLADRMFAYWCNEDVCEIGGIANGEMSTEE